MTHDFEDTRCGITEAIADGRFSPYACEPDWRTVKFGFTAAEERALDRANHRAVARAQAAKNPPPRQALGPTLDGSPRLDCRCQHRYGMLGLNDTFGEACFDCERVVWRMTGPPPIDRGYPGNLMVGPFRFANEPRP